MSKWKSKSCDIDTLTSNQNCCPVFWELHLVCVLCATNRQSCIEALRKILSSEWELRLWLHQRCNVLRKGAGLVVAKPSLQGCKVSKPATCLRRRKWHQTSPITFIQTYKPCMRSFWKVKHVFTASLLPFTAHAAFNQCSLLTLPLLFKRSLFAYDRLGENVDPKFQRVQNIKDSLVCD